ATVPGHPSASADRLRGGRAVRCTFEPVGIERKVEASSEYSLPRAIRTTEPDTFMLERARQHLAELSADNIELRQCPAEDLPFPEGSFDSAVSTMVFCSVSVPNKALAEIRRVLKPSGTFRFIEHVRPEGGLKARIFDAITPIWSWFGAGCHPNRRTLESIEQAGFEVEKLERVTLEELLVVPFNI